MTKILIIRWIIMHLDQMTFSGMRWEDRDQGIFSLYWKHQSSRSCRENTSGSSSLYEYYRAWAVHKNNNRRRQPRDLKAAFRNALEKKPELERLKTMDTRERIYWRIKGFPDGQNKCEPTEAPSKKLRGSNRGKKTSNNMVENVNQFTSAAGEGIVNLGASTSSAGEGIHFESKKRKQYKKRGKKSPAAAGTSLTNEPAVNDVAPVHEDGSNPSPLPPFRPSFGDFPRNPDLNVSSTSACFSETSFDKSKNENFWNPQICVSAADRNTPPQLPSDQTVVPFNKSKNENFWNPQIFGFPTDRNTPPQLSPDPTKVQYTELMDFLVPNQSNNYPFLNTPPQQPSDINLEHTGRNPHHAISPVEHKCTSTSSDIITLLCLGLNITDENLDLPPEQ